MLTPKKPRLPDPAIPDDVTGFELDRAVKNQLRTLSKENAVGVGQHLVMVATFLDTDIEAARDYAHFFFFRASIHAPGVREPLPGLARLDVGSLDELDPGVDERVDRICAEILGDQQIIRQGAAS